LGRDDCERELRSRCTPGVGGKPASTGHHFIWTITFLVCDGERARYNSERGGGLLWRIGGSVGRRVGDGGVDDGDIFFDAGNKVLNRGIGGSYTYNWSWCCVGQQDGGVCALIFVATERNVCLWRSET
jgi:hypothetical protein